MRVALIQESVSPERGGAETSTRQMATQLAALGADVTVVCAVGRRGGEPRAAFYEGRVRYEPLVANGVLRSMRSYGFIRAAQQYCIETGFDIVHAITPCLAADVYQPRGGTLPETVRRSTAMVQASLPRRLRRLGKRFNLRQRLMCGVERRLLTAGTGAVHVAALSGYVARQVQADYQLPQERIHLVYNGVEVGQPLDEVERAGQRADIRKRLKLAPDAHLALFVAHNFRLKGLSELIRAAAEGRLNGTSWALAVIGREAPGRYMRLAQKLGLADRVRFLDAQVDLRPWYAAADVLAHPTWYDPCSRVVLEAAAMGLPVVTTRWNGAAEVLKPGVTGEILADSADIRGLAAAIGRALHPAFRSACLAHAPRIREYVSMSRHARELLALYEQVLTERRNARDSTRLQPIS